MGPQLDTASPDGNAGRIAIEGWVTRAAGEALLQANGLNYTDLVQAASRSGFKPIELRQHAGGRLRNAIRRASSSNVLAMIPGSKRPKEIVVYMAHWDHLGRSLGRSGDNIFNGALDNASGTAGLLAIAKAFAESPRRPERSVVFLGLTLEESGLLGSAYYAANPVFPLRQTVAALNMDALSWGGPTRDVSVIGFGASELEEYLAAAAKTQDRVLREEPTPEKGFFYRSDHFNFAKVGVPALYFKMGVEDRENGVEWARAKQAEFTLRDYHKPSDEWRPGTDLRGSLEDLELLYAVGARLAREKRFPQWYPTSEFRAARDRTFAAP
jgi:Zn-dependent M28 family amino/carboxypeptidase